MSSLGEMLTEQEIALMMGESGAVDGKVGYDDHHGDNDDDDDDPDPDHQNHGEDNFSNNGRGMGC